MRGLRQRHVLVIDGAEAVGELMRDALEEAGYRVSTTTETPVELANIAEDGVDLVVLDPGIGSEDPGGWFRQCLEHDAMGIPWSSVRAIRGFFATWPTTWRNGTSMWCRSRSLSTRCSTSVLATLVHHLRLANFLELGAVFNVERRHSSILRR